MEGFHSWRIFDIAILDVIGTIFIAYCLSFAFKLSFLKTIIVLFIIAEILHWLFCVDTTIIRVLKKLYSVKIHMAKYFMMI